MDILKLTLEVLIVLLLAFASFYDIKTRKIPNLILLFILVIDLFYMFLSNALLSNLLGMLFPALILILLNITYKNFIGNGDIKLFMATGLFIGYQANVMLFIFSCIACIIFTVFYKLFFKKNISMLPFSPFIFLCLLVYLISQ